jgi:hypothetical protein
MATNKTPIRIELADDERETLEQVARRAAPHRDVVRAQVILSLASGMSVSAVGRQVGLARRIVCKWADRFGCSRARVTRQRNQVVTPSMLSCKPLKSLSLDLGAAAPASFAQRVDDTKGVHTALYVVDAHDICSEKRRAGDGTMCRCVPLLRLRLAHDVPEEAVDAKRSQLEGEDRDPVAHHVGSGDKRRLEEASDSEAADRGGPPRPGAPAP